MTTETTPSGAGESSPAPDGSAADQRDALRYRKLRRLVERRADSLVIAIQREGEWLPAEMPCFDLDRLVDVMPHPPNKSSTFGA